jgi:hypothetical protein
MTTYLPNLILVASRGNAVQNVALVAGSVSHAVFSASIPDSKLATISSANKVASSANASLTAATSSATANTLVKRDSNAAAAFASVVLTNGAFSTTLNAATLTADRTYTVKDEAGTIATLTAAASTVGGADVTINDAANTVGTDLVAIDPGDGSLTFHVATYNTYGLLTATSQNLPAACITGQIAVNHTALDEHGASVRLSDATGSKLVTNGFDYSIDSNGLNIGHGGLSNVVPLAAYPTSIFGSTSQFAFWTSNQAEGSVQFGTNNVKTHALYNLSNTIWHCGTGGSGTNATLTLRIYQFAEIVYIAIPSFSMVNGSSNLTYLEMYNATQNASSKTLTPKPATAQRAGDIRVTEGANTFTCSVIIQTDGSIRVFKQPANASFVSGATTAMAEQTFVCFTI